MFMRFRCVKLMSITRLGQGPHCKPYLETFASLICDATPAGKAKLRLTSMPLPFM